jgi:hypothetical protein
MIYQQKINVKTRIPFRKESAMFLHTKNIEAINTYCHKYNVPIPPETNFFNSNKHILSSLPILTRNLLTKGHHLSKFTKFLRENKLHLVQADKTPHLCIIDEVLYDHLIDRHIQDQNTYERIPQNRDDAINRVLRKAITDLGKAINCQIKIPTNIKGRPFKILIKLQKPCQDWHRYPDIPKTRPVVSDVGSVTYLAAKAILPFLQKIERKLKYTCTSALSALCRINNLNANAHFKSHILTQADFDNMYTNINTHSLISILKSSTYILPNKIIFLKALELILRYTTFVTKQGTYLQKNGLPMGSPISGTLANIYIDAYERKIIPKYEGVIYLRYIDDILLITPPNHNPNTILGELEEHTGIKLTAESSQGSADFLDLRLQKDIYGRIITKTFFKFAAPILRPNIPNHKRESKTIIGQFLRVWRNSNDNLSLTNQIIQSLRHLSEEGIPREYMNGIIEFLKPILIPNIYTRNIFSHKHTVCTHCREIMKRYNIKVEKMFEFGNTVVASKKPMICWHHTGLIIFKHKLSSLWDISNEKSIHWTMNRYSHLASIILPIGNPPATQMGTIMERITPFMREKIRIEKPTEEPYPVYVYPIIHRPTETYGIPTAPRKERLLRNA